MVICIEIQTFAHIVFLYSGSTKNIFYLARYIQTSRIFVQPCVLDPVCTHIRSQKSLKNVGKRPRNHKEWSHSLPSIQNGRNFEVEAPDFDLFLLSFGRFMQEVSYFNSYPSQKSY